MDKTKSTWEETYLHALENSNENDIVYESDSVVKAERKLAGLCPDCGMHKKGRHYPSCHVTIRRLQRVVRDFETIDPGLRERTIGQERHRINQLIESWKKIGYPDD